MAPTSEEPSRSNSHTSDDAPVQPTLDEIRQQYEEVGTAPPLPNIPLPEAMEDNGSTIEVASTPSHSHPHRQSVAQSMRPSFSHQSHTYGDDELDVNNLPITDAQRARIVSRQYVILPPCFALSLWSVQDVPTKGKRV